ncbi:MAG TPA: histidine kinase dimerization/phospho-acceptor domain-containing protein, partial [Polyangiales bacterium]
MSAPRTLILVPSRESRDRLVTLAEGLPWAPGRGISFTLWTGDLQKVVADHRATDPSAPIAVITEDEPAALAALSSGADEVVVGPDVSAAGLAALADRAETRARLRAENRRLQANFAHSEKLVALGTLVAGVGHEINNPLSAVMLSVEVAQRRVVPLLQAAMDLGRAQRQGEELAPLLARLNELTQPERASRDAL